MVQSVCSNRQRLHPRSYLPPTATRSTGNGDQSFWRFKLIEKHRRIFFFNVKSSVKLINLAIACLAAEKNCCTGESPHKQRTFKPSRSRVFCNAEIRPIFPEYLISRSIFMFIYTIKYFTYLKGHSMANAPCSVLYLTNVSCIHVQIMSNKHSS